MKHCLFFLLSVLASVDAAHVYDLVVYGGTSAGHVTIDAVQFIPGVEQ
ncbi:MAG TPA: hypothetical protein QGH16_09300 [Verrucomicrobiota bacterium]|nr:hypothetical protein [Verrucomicrobiota bacterium]